MSFPHGLTVVALLLATPAAVRPVSPAAGVVTLSGPVGDSLETATPTFVITTSDFGPGEEPTSLRLTVSTRADFSLPALDTVIIGSNGSITLRRPLRERTAYYFRASARSASGQETFSQVIGPLTTVSWLTLVTPNSLNGSTVDTRRPAFVWSSIDVATPPGPWLYDIHIINVATQSATVIRGILDTVFTPPFELDANTSYRWAVTARLQNGDTTRVNSVGSFVVTTTDRPPLTLLYQNFPNPFPSGDRTSTCFWFDLSDRSQVSLEIRDLRGNMVRQLLVGNELPEVLPAGKYGRSAATGCDPRFSWDGRADNGQFVPKGLYLLRLRTNRGQFVKKVFFLGR